MGREIRAGKLRTRETSQAETGKLGKAGKTCPMNKTRNKELDGKIFDTNESALSRWSRRKSLSRTVEADPKLQAESPENILENVSTQEVTDASSDSTPAEVKEFTDEDMPTVESLDENSDYAGFLSAGVSEKLRRAALRKLFHLEIFNVVDGLDDYAEDYTKFEKLGSIITSDMRLQMQRAEQALKQETASEAAVPEQEPGNDAVIADAGDLEETEDLSDDLTGPGHEQDKQVD
jgi:hypothetical protein